jgi:CRISPR-associated protein Cmr3
MSHPCYTRGEELWCGFVESEQEAIRYTPDGYEFFGGAPSGQAVFVPIKVADLRKQQIEHTPGEHEPQTLRSAIEEIVHASLTKSELEIKIPEIAKQFKYHTIDIWRLYQTKEQEIEETETRSDRVSEINQLLKIGNYELKLSKYLRPRLADPLEKIAGYLGSNSAAMLTTLLPVAGSLLKTGTQLELIRATEFYALPVVYTGIVAESGSAKSPTQKTILKPLFKLQALAEEDHQFAIEGWEQEVRDKRNTDEKPPEKPPVREYYTTDATREAVIMIQAQQPDLGFLGWFDELSALIGTQNQYRNGKGADKEAILSGRDGTGIKMNRASGKRAFVKSSAFSITGSTQPDTLRKMIGDFSDPTGQWARFLWTVLPIKPARFPEDETSYDISDFLEGVYVRLASFDPQTYRMSTEARSLYANWYNELDDLRLTQPQQGLRAVYAKMKGDTGTLALLLHCINSAIDSGCQPSADISADTMRAAISLAKFYIGQVKLIHADGSTDSGEIEQSYTKLIRLSERKGYIKARDAQSSDRVFRKMPTDRVRSHFRELEAMGLGTTRGTGRTLEWKAKPYALMEFPDSPIADGRTPKLAAIADTAGQIADTSKSGQTKQNQGTPPKLLTADSDQFHFNGNGKRDENKKQPSSTLSAEETRSISNSSTALNPDDSTLSANPSNLSADQPAPSANGEEGNGSVS